MTQLRVLQELETALTKATQESVENRDRWIRAVAETENARERCAPSLACLAQLLVV